MSHKTTVTADPKAPVIRIERDFDAPCEKVFTAFTSADKLTRWWSPGEHAHIELDAREGGAWKFTDVVPGGGDIVFYGYFHELTAPERIVQTSEFANVGERGHVVLEKYEFTPLGGGRTRMLLTEVFMSYADRDAAAQSGMEQGLAQSYINLDTVLTDNK